MRSWELFAVVLVLGCNGNPVEPHVDPCEAARAIRSSPTFLTVAEEGDIAARVLPGGFGGLYQEFGGNSNGILVAYFNDLSVSGEAKTDLRKVLLCGGAYPGWAGVLLSTDLDAIAIRQGLYTGSELLSYLRALEPLKNDAGVWAIELDPEANRVWIGLTTGSALTRIQESIAARSVPAGAVLIEVPPPTTSAEQFQVLDSPAVTVDEGDPGVLFFSLRVRFTNRQTSPRYPDWCVDPDPNSLTTYFLHTIQQWNGTQWKEVKAPLCNAILLPPRFVGPGESVTDSVPVVGVRRLNAIPHWLTARITGTYRFVGKVFRSTIPNPQGGPPLVTDLAAPEEQVSAPFRLINTRPF